MGTSANQSPVKRPLWMRLLTEVTRYLAIALMLGLWTAVAVIRGQPQMVLIPIALAFSLLYLFFWVFRMLLSRKARLAFKGEGRTFWEGAIPLLMLWMGWAFSLINPPLHDIFLGVSVLTTIFFCIGAYAAYVTIPREGEKIPPRDMDGSAEGCLEAIFSGLTGG